ncbi:MarR family transcriptional regulator [Rathayibacter sp. YIM 133350]|uniref:MarR family winged helix-turn-helix transcriptional regulator n=1 Tax=Rathayibacter sp. YIM 133350 TaxID=3131992 RepID=UPI00307F82C9
MTSEEKQSTERSRRRATTDLKDALRELRVQLSVLNHQVGVRADLRDVDLDCLDLISAEGPLAPSALARLAGVHPATLTGILDRLERGGWIRRQRDEADRRSILVSIDPARNAEMFRHYAPMNARMDAVCAEYDPAQLALVADFLTRAADAGRSVTEQMVAAKD